MLDFQLQAADAGETLRRCRQNLKRRGPLDPVVTDLGVAVAAVNRGRDAVESDSEIDRAAERNFHGLARLQRTELNAPQVRIDSVDLIAEPVFDLNAHGGMLDPFQRHGSHDDLSRHARPEEAGVASRAG